MELNQLIVVSMKSLTLRVVRELVEESEDDEEAMDVTWDDFLDRWDCWVCFMEVLEVE
nr:MAG TPA: hypothetical protein [Caudoviricetes sp.]